MFLYRISFHFQNWGFHYLELFLNSIVSIFMMSKILKVAIICEVRIMSFIFMSIFYYTANTFFT
jgi:hypothetical protein